MAAQKRENFVRRTGRKIPFFLWLVFGFCLPGSAKERFERRFDETSGLAVPAVYALTQDTQGFLWIGTTGGLYRFDGSEIQAWARESFAGVISSLLSGPDGEVFFVDENEKMYQVSADGIRPFPGPDGKPLAEVAGAAFSADRSRLCVAKPEELFCKDAALGWSSWPRKVLAGERIRRVKRGTEDSVFVLTDLGIWKVGPGEAVAKVSNVGASVDVVSSQDGALYVLSWPKNGEVHEIRDRATKPLLSLSARPIDLTSRGDAVWASFDRHLAVFRQGEPPELIGPAEGLPSGGPLLVDSEGSLWVGTFQGLLQYPEPETVTFTHRDGLPSSHTRFLARTKEGIWVATWQGLGKLEKEQGIWKAKAENLNHIGAFCAEQDGEPWFHAYDGGTFRRGQDRFIELSAPRFLHLFSCASDSGGSQWLATDRGLLLIGTGLRSRFVAVGPDQSESSVEMVFRDEGDGLWASSQQNLCRAKASAIMSGQPVFWDCQRLEGVQRVTDMIQTPGGGLWVSTHSLGVWRWENEKWEWIPGSKGLASGRVWGLERSPSGGVWILGDGVCVRVVERPESRDGWEVVERLSTWQGLPAGGAEDLFEEPDGSLWIATIGGVVRMPVQARNAGPLPPPVKLVRFFLNGEARSASDEIRAPHDSNQLEFLFGALSYRDRNRLRYQYRLNRSDAWADSQTSGPHFRFVDLNSGSYFVEMRASLDGKDWSDPPAGFAFEVLTPWHLQPWFLLAAALALMVALYAVYRIRVAFLLRLERQRTQIAMDLHDELGSGLGSIGILSNIAIEKNLGSVERNRLASKISETSRELGAALTDIVWALQPASNNLESLAFNLVEHAERLFSGNQTRFSTDFPENWTLIRLSLATRRNLQLIGREALYNAARHSGGLNFTLGFQPLGRKWRMWIADDGQGFAERELSQKPRGVGLASMRRRAREIGAEITWTSRTGKGTRVDIVFSAR